MKKTEHSVFISYRRKDFALARQFYDHLALHHYDVFLDKHGNFGVDWLNFTQTVLQNIDSRAHFLLVLTPSALEDVYNTLYFRKEIDHAINLGRNIVPIFAEGFTSDQFATHLTADTATTLQSIQPILFDPEHPKVMMKQLRKRLREQIRVRRFPASPTAQAYAEKQKAVMAVKHGGSETKQLAQELVDLAWNTRRLRDGQYRAFCMTTDAIDLAPNFALAYSTRGITFYSRQEAIADVEIAFEMEPNNPRIIDHHGLVYMNIQEYDIAIHDFTRAIELDPNFAQAYSHRGIAYKRKDEFDKAIQDHNRAVELEPDNAYFYNSRGITYYEMSRSRKSAPQGVNYYLLAIEDYRKAVELAPDNNGFKENLRNAQ